MRGLLAILVLALAAIAAACATSSPVEQSVGGSSSVGTPGGVGGAIGADPDGGPRSCGLIDTNPACNSCIEASCCGPAQACAGDAACVACLGEPATSEDCIVEQTFSMLEACLVDRCAGLCTSGGSSTSSSGGGSTAASSSSASSTSAASSTSSSAASSTSSSTGASSTSSTSAGSSSSSSSSTSSSSSSSSSSSGSPTSCATADGDVGCCDPNGVLYFCDVTQTLYAQTCVGGAVCGWNGAKGYYDCVPPPGGADPSNTYPLACPGP